MAHATPTRLLVAFVAGEHVADASEWLRLLRAACPDVEFVVAVDADQHVDAAVVASPARGVLARFSGLRLIQSCWAGVDALLEDDTLPPGVPLARMVDPALADAAAQTALWATLSLHRGFFAYAARSAAGVWQKHAQLRADEVPVLVLGHGAMGSRISARLALMGYPVIAWRSGDKGGEDDRGGSTVAATSVAVVPGSVAVLCGKGALFAAALPAAPRVVICALPLTPATRGLLDARFFRALPTGAGIVNLGRGGHVVTHDLLAALAAGTVGHAVLDVFDEEPLPRSSPLWAHPHVTVLPHVAALTDPRSAVRVVAENLRRLASGEALVHVVDRTRGY